MTSCCRQVEAYELYWHEIGIQDASRDAALTAKI